MSVEAEFFLFSDFYIIETVLVRGFKVPLFFLIFSQKASTRCLATVHSISKRQFIQERIYF